MSETEREVMFTYQNDLEKTAAAINERLKAGWQLVSFNADKAYFMKTKDVNGDLVAALQGLVDHFCNGPLIPPSGPLWQAARKALKDAGGNP